MLIIMLFGAIPLIAQTPCIKKAEQAIQTENYTAALTTLQGCNETPEKFRIKGICFYHMYNADSAITMFEKALAKMPGDEAVLLNGAEALLWKKEFKRAGMWLQNVADKRSSSYRRVFALRLEMVGNYAQALAMYDTVIAMEKKPWATMIHKGEVLSWMKKFDLAIDLFNNVSADTNAPRDQRMYALVRHAEVMAWQKQFSEALTEFDAIIAMEPKPSQAPLTIRSRVLEAIRLKGTVLEWDGRYKEARDAYKNMLIIDPDNKQAKLLLEKLLWVK